MGPNPKPQTQSASKGNPHLVCVQCSTYLFEFEDIYNQTQSASKGNPHLVCVQCSTCLFEFEDIYTQTQSASKGNLNLVCVQCSRLQVTDGLGVRISYE